MTLVVLQNDFTIHGSRRKIGRRTIIQLFCKVTKNYRYLKWNYRVIERTNHKP